MKPATRKFYLILTAGIGLSVLTDHAQQVPVGHATDFVSSTYFEPPNEQQVKLKLSGAEALPLPGGVQDIHSRLKARETPQPRFCWHCRKPLHARTDRCPFCGESQ